MVSWRKPSGSQIVAALAIALACVLGYMWVFCSRTATVIYPHHRPLMPVSQLAAWQHTEGGVTVSDLVIRAEPEGLTRAIPGAGVTITNRSDSAQIVAVHIALYDADLKLVATCCLKTAGPGIVESGRAVTPVEMLAVPRSDVARVHYVTIRVTRSKAP